MSPVITECSKRPPPFWWDPVFIVLSEDRVHKVLGRWSNENKSLQHFGGSLDAPGSACLFRDRKWVKLGTWNQERGQNGFSEAGTNQREG